MPFGNETGILVSAVIFGLTGIYLVVYLWLFTFYPLRRASRISGHVLHRYVPAVHENDVAGDTPGMVTIELMPRSWVRRAMGLPSNDGRGFLFFYVGRNGKGLYFNHSKSKRESIRIDVLADDLLERVGEARMHYRKWDRALAVPVSYSGPGTIEHCDLFEDRLRVE